MRTRFAAYLTPSVGTIEESSVEHVCLVESALRANFTSQPRWGLPPPDSGGEKVSQRPSRSKATRVTGRKHTPEQIVPKLREADRLLGKVGNLCEVNKQLGINEATFRRRFHPPVPTTISDVGAT